MLYKYFITYVIYKMDKKDKLYFCCITCVRLITKNNFLKYNKMCYDCNTNNKNITCLCGKLYNDKGIYKMCYDCNTHNKNIACLCGKLYNDKGIYKMCYDCNTHNKNIYKK
jgi:hypothetical protein